MDIKLFEQSNENKIDDVISSIILNTFENFKYTEIPIEEYKKIALKTIKDTKKLYNCDMNYAEFLSEELERNLKKYIKKLFSDSQHTLKIVNNYINQKFSTINSYEESINAFDELNKFFNEYSFMPNCSFLTKLINDNYIFNKIIKLVVENQSSKEIFEILDNNLLILSFDTYCDINNLSQITDESEFTDDTNKYMSDSDSVYLKEISRIPLLSIEEEKLLAKKVAEGDIEARNLFIESNLKLVVFVAKRYRDYNLPFLDLIEEGNIGLMKAVDRFDVEKGFKFSTYAIWWINQTILRAIADKSRNIRIPFHMHERVLNYSKTVNNMETRDCKVPTIIDVAHELKIPVSKAYELCALQVDTKSINEPVDEDGSTIEDYLVSDEQTPEEIVIAKSFRSQLKKIFKDCKLKDREIEILMLRYGITTDYPKTLEEIGMIYNITRERVRQLEAKALKKIRTSKHIGELAKYIGKEEDTLEIVNSFKNMYENNDIKYVKKINK